MILIACFQCFFHPHPPPPPKKKNPRAFLRTFFYETGRLPDTNTVDNISQEISYGSMVIFS